jgi:hypothetical protein
MAKPGYFCHPERREGSQLPENTRFFAALRMTNQLYSQLKVFSYPLSTSPSPPDGGRGDKRKKLLANDRGLGFAIADRQNDQVLMVG